MMIARWQIVARFGHKAEALALLKEWNETVGAHIGWDPSKLRVLVGSVGADESLLISEVEIADLADLEAAWAKMATASGHGDWSKRLEQHVVSGSNRWEVFRVV